MTLTIIGILTGVIVAITGFLAMIWKKRRILIAKIGVISEIIILSLWLGGLIKHNNKTIITDRLFSIIERLSIQEQLDLAKIIEDFGINNIKSINKNNIILFGKLVNERTGTFLFENGIMNFSIDNIQLPITRVINGNIVYSISSEYRTKPIIWEYENQNKNKITRGTGIFYLNKTNINFYATVLQTPIVNTDNKLHSDSNGTIVLQGSIKDDQGNPIVGALVSYVVNGISRVYPQKSSLTGGRVIIELEGNTQDKIITITVSKRGKTVSIPLTVKNGQYFEVTL